MCVALGLAVALAPTPTILIADTFPIDTEDPTVEATIVAHPEGPGQPGKFMITSPDTDVTKFRYGWTEAVVNEVAAETVAGVAGKSATVTSTAPKYGENVLYLQAIDSAGNVGDGSL